MENKPNDLTIDNLVARFRPNYVINAEEAFEEMSYKTILIGDQYFEVKFCNQIVIQTVVKLLTLLYKFNSTFQEKQKFMKKLF